MTEQIRPTAVPEALKPGELARVMRVDPKTVTRWAKADRIESFKTPGGHTRFRTENVIEMLLKSGASLAEAYDLITRSIDDD